MLTDYAVASRYPGDVERIIPPDHKQAVQLAQVVLTWAAQIVQ